MSGRRDEPTPDGAGDQLEQLQRQCREDATRVQQGRFRLDWQRALDKIKDFQLADPHRYVLEVVQAAVAGGATSVEVQTDTDDVVLTFDGRVYDRRELERLFDYLFTREPELEPLRQLALGVNAALALRPRFVTVDSGDGQRGFRLRLSSHQDVEVSALPKGRAPAGTRVQVRDRISFKVISRAVGEAVEAGLLREACRHLPVPLLMDGADARQPLTPGRAGLAFDVAGIRGEMVLPDDVSVAAPPAISVLINGVEVCLLDEDSARRVGIPVRGYVDNPALTRNASHSGIHDNKELKRTVGRLRMEARKLLRKWLRELLPLEPEGRAEALRARAFSSVERDLLYLSARQLVRASRKTDLPPELDALLDLPAMVQLAVKEPPRAPLRPVWQLFREHGRYHAAEQVHDLAREDLPPDLLPVLGPMDLLEPIFGKPRPANEQLGQIATRAYNRRQRQQNPLSAALPPGVALVKVPLDDEATGLRGELGLCEPEATREVQSVLADLARRHGDADDTPQDAGPRPSVTVTYLQRGALLGQRRITGPGFWGAAVVDCLDFEANETWSDVRPNRAFKAVPRALSAAVPALLRRLHEAFPTLPPPASQLAAGSWDADRGEHDGLPLELSMAWTGDVTSRRARRFADQLLIKLPKVARAEAPWLFSWPLFYSIHGEALCLDQLRARSDDVRYVVDAPWGESPDDMLLVNVSALQKRALQRYLPGNLHGGKGRLNQYRRQQARAAERRAAYERNFARAELSFQLPRLDGRDYLAIIDLDIPDAEGQAGVPRQPSASLVRLLVGGVPLVELPLKKTIPVHAVIQSSRAQPNDDFSDLADASVGRDLVGRVRKAVPALVGALASCGGALTSVGADTVWRFLKRQQTPKKRPFKNLPDGLADLPLVDTVAHGQFSLRQVYDEGQAHHGRVLHTTIDVTRQLSQRPILRGDAREMKLLRRLLHVRTKNHDLPLNAELGALARMDQPRQPARLSGQLLARRPVEGEQISGELGLPRDALWRAEAGPATSEVKVLREGVQLCRRPMELFGLRALAVVECPRLTPSAMYDDIKQDDVWREVTLALQAAARRLLLELCRRLGQEPGRSDGLAAAVQLVAGHLFAGRPRLAQEPADDLRKAVAAAPAWPSPDPQRGLHTLAELAEACAGPAVLWVVASESGHLAPGRVMVRAAGEQTHQALERIFGGEVQSGARVLRRDSAAHVRRQAAPALERLSAGEVLAPTEIDEDHELVSMRGQAGVYNAYERAPAGKLLLRVGLAGRLLVERAVPHPLRGVAQIDCQRLEPNRDWNGVANQRQLEVIEQRAAEALWRAAGALADRMLRPGAPPPTPRVAGRLLLLEMLAGRPKEADERQLQAPLFRTVHDQRISASALQQRAAAEGHVLVVSDALGGGVPADGRTIVRAGPTAMAVLESLLGSALKRHDDVWRQDLAGQARRRETPVSTPDVSEVALEQVYFNAGPSSGLAGLLPLTGDLRSLVRLHVGNRQVASREPRWQPAVEVWLNDDRLQPTRDFVDVVQDEVYQQAMATAEAQVPELLAAAAARLVHRRQTAHGDTLGAWLRAHVMTQLQRLQVEAAATPLGPASRLLRAAMWRCLTGEGERWLDTAELLAAAGAGQLALVPHDASGRPADPTMVLLPASTERQALQGALGELPDHGDRLRRDQAYRTFCWRKQVPRVDLSRAGVGDLDRLLWRHALDNAGWEGELGLLPGGGRSLTVTLFWERRRLAALTLPCAAPAVGAVQCSLWSINDDYSDVVQDEAYEAWVLSLQEEVAGMLRRAAAALPDLPRRRRERLGPALVAALAAADADEDSASRSLADALMKAPLLCTAAGGQMSVADAVERDGPLPVITPGSAARGRSQDRQPVVVLSMEERPALERLVRLEPVDDRYLQGVEARRRRERAPARPDVSWFRAVARGEAQSEHLRGELALKLSAPPGKLCLMSEGRVVEQRAFPALVGLVGYVDGKLATDRAFRKVHLNRRQDKELTALYVERLEQVVQLAAEYRGRRWRKWRRLAALTTRYLWHALRHTGLEREPLRERVLARDTTLPPAVVRALDLRLFRLGDGAWVDLATVIAREDDPLVVLCTDEVKDTGATFVVGQAEVLRPLLALLLPADAVADHAGWAARTRRAAVKDEAPGELADERLLSGVRSTLRAATLHDPAAAGPSRLRVSTIKKIELAPLARSTLTAVDRGGDEVSRIKVNPQHALWRAAARAGAGAGITPVKQLTAALLGLWCREPSALVSGREVVRLLTAMAALAAAGPKEPLVG